MKKPFTAHYNSYTECIELLDNATQMKELALSIQSDMNALVAALDRRT
jgi:PHP family Zn ribbon phosphoesterase